MYAIRRERLGGILTLALVSIVGLTNCSTNDNGTPDAGTAADAGNGADGGTVNTHYTQTNLVSDGSVSGTTTNTNLVNPWGIASDGTGAFWISDNGTGVTTAFTGAGVAEGSAVTIPPPANSPSGTLSAPTGVTFNSNTSNFKGDTFIFVTEGGTIAGFQNGTSAVTRVDTSASGAVYKGITIDAANSGPQIFVTNFHDGKVEIYNSSYNLVSSFTDTTLPSGYAPFGIANFNGQIYVTFALQDAAKHDDVPGLGNGFVDIFDTSGNMVKRLVSQGDLNAPWGLALAPGNFGTFSNALLVGNFGDGKIHGYDPTTGTEIGEVKGSNGNAITIDGLWGLAFGNGGQAGSTNSLFFTAGPQDETHGLFGRIDVP